ncbi:sigma-70 family RNA polymerase sigma factor [uncultured Bacteroides sp.]|uniref:RNA polymerase sigma factor n=1 Tax=uncultured Bacteroides sp. TaxID=162156 RepID=UPI002AABBF7F|nr:sigma-70 family RNA polymerase sigma factor [uncultured Bacteroides sp.]
MDAESFKKLYLPYHQKLYRIAYKLLGNQCDAEDMVQEAYLKLWNKRDELIDIKNPESFSVILLKNICFDYLRSTKNDIGKQDIEVVGKANEVSLINEIETKDELNCVKQLITQLPGKQQEVMKLRHLSECSIEEIEQITGLNAINIRVLISRARKTIREQFNILRQ